MFRYLIKILLLSLVSSCLWDGLDLQSSEHCLLVECDTPSSSKDNCYQNEIIQPVRLQVSKYDKKKWVHKYKTI